VRLLLALLVLLVAAPSAAAQSPIAGGGSFNDAPVLGPGRYKDTLRGGEQLFYAVQLKPGQKLTAGATVTGRTDGSYIMKLALYSPLREKDVFDGEQSEPYGQTDRSASMRVEGQPVGEEDSGSAGDRIYSEPGTYYISLAADDLGSEPGAEQFDSTIDLQVAGQPIPEATPTKTAEPAATVESGGTAGLGGGDDGGGSGELGMAIVLGLALGGLVGFGVRRLRTTA
jgi:Ca-activated chloride channel family protein